MPEQGFESFQLRLPNLLFCFSIVVHLFTSIWYLEKDSAEPKLWMVDAKVRPILKIVAVKYNELC